MTDRSDAPFAAVQPALVIGARGMLGTAWSRLLRRHNLAAASIDIDEIDITDPASVERVIEPQYKLIVNCAAWTDVDGAEEHEEDARRVNALGVGNLAERCKQTGATLVHYSTDYVFNGTATSPIPVDATIEPIGAYGRTKAEGEQLIRATGCDHLIIRTSWLYAPWGKNFVLTIAKLAAARDSLKIVDDQRGRPSSALHLASRSLDLLEARARGTFHVCDGGECTWYGFGRKIVELTGAECQIDACTTDEFPRPAPRPAYSVLDLAQTEELIGPMRSWELNLADTIAEMKPAIGAP